jgi:hypothetical protein
MTVKTKATFEFNGKTYEAEERWNSGSEQRKKTRAHVWGPGDDRCPTVEFRFLAEHIGAPSVYTKKGEFPALDKAFRVMNKEIVAAKREVLDAAIKALEVPWYGEPKFSRKAGCPCGCSPGFIIDESYGKTVYISEAKATA